MSLFLELGSQWWLLEKREICERMLWLSLRKRGRRVGRQAQTIPILVSTAIQMAMGTTESVCGWALAGSATSTDGRD